MERRSKESAKLPPGTPVVNADEPSFFVSTTFLGLGMAGPAVADSLD
jgi:hypothetical protein